MLRAQILTSIFAVATLIPWNSVVTVDDFWHSQFQSDQLNIFTLFFQATLLLVNLFGVFVLSDFAFWKRLLFGNVVSALVLVALLLVKSLPVVYVLMLIFGFVDGILEATLYGYATTVQTTQHAQGGQSASGAIVSVIRIITKLVFVNHESGAELSAYLFFSISAFLCILAAVASLSIRSIETTRHRKLGRNRTLILGIIRNCWPDMLTVFINYTLTLAIFPTFFVTALSSHEWHVSMDWLMVICIALFNIFDFIGKQFLGTDAIRAKIKFLKLRVGLLSFVISRLTLCVLIVLCNRSIIPSATVLSLLAALLGLTNGCASVNCFVSGANNARDWYMRRHLMLLDDVALQSLHEDEMETIPQSETDDYKEMEETIGYLMVASLCVGLAVGLSIGYGFMQVLLLFS